MSRDRRARPACLLLVPFAFLHVEAAIADPSEAAQLSAADLGQLSIEQLANVQITSVSKTSEPLSDAPAAIYVISHDDIVRSGATTIPEMLRLAPNLEVAQLSATNYAISARGFNVGNNASMSDKLLVLIDGRSVYTPLFAGVYWDMQQVLPEDIERIEVISGPAGTLWGANAVNGVVNIITRGSADTQGGVLSLGAGNLERSGSLQYGGRLADDLTYRVHVEGSQFSPNKLANGADANDAWSRPQGGFRIDWTPPHDVISAQGDIYQASEEPGNSIGGRDLLTSWQHDFAGGSTLQATAYFDEAKRLADNSGSGFIVDTYNLDLQHSFSLGDWNSVVWGAGYRAVSFRIQSLPALAFIPSDRTLNLINLFGQDTIAVTGNLRLTLGLKLENDEPYTGFEPMPSARLSWKATDDVLLWAAVSRAVRAPTPVDRDIVERIGSIDFLKGSSQFTSEEVIAYELGTRVQATPRVSFSVSSFYNDYDHLRSIEFTPVTLLPLHFGNLMKGRVYGLEAWGDWRVTDWWRLTAGFNVQHEHLRFEPGSSAIGGLTFTADDPNHQASLRSSVDLGHGVTWDADVRYVGALPNPSVPEYAELDTRVAWAISDALDISVSGFNLLHPKHTEFIEAGTSDEVPRSFFVETRWRF